MGAGDSLVDTMLGAPSTVPQGVVGSGMDRNGRPEPSVAVAGEYHDTDFDWSEAEFLGLQRWAELLLAAVAHDAERQPGTEAEVQQASTQRLSGTPAGASLPWEAFHAVHSAGRFYRPRRYLLHEFPVLSSSSLTLLELGCGAGASLLPVLQANPGSRVVGCDVSRSALETLQRRAGELRIDPRRLACHMLDLECPAPEPLFVHASFQAVLLVFTLSALSPQGVLRALRLAASALVPGGQVLIRDYGLYDMVHLRFLERAVGEAVAGMELDPLLQRQQPPVVFVRGEGTRATFFSLEELERLAAQAGLHVEQARYACVLAKRKSGAPPLRRVFVHLVLHKVAS